MNTSNPTEPELPPLHATLPGLYRHYKGGWYEVIDTVRCSETLMGMTLYRALYGGFGLWVRPTVMFSESGLFQGKTQARFARHDIATVHLADHATAIAVLAHLRGLSQRCGFDLGTVLSTPPTAPTTCFGLGCDARAWESYFTALRQWRDDACELLGKTP